MIFKFLAFAAVIFFIYIVFFKNSRQKDKKYDNITDTMVECPTCKIYVSKDDTILSNGKYFCSKECIK